MEENQLSPVVTKNIYAQMAGVILLVFVALFIGACSPSLVAPPTGDPCKSSDECEKGQECTNGICLQINSNSESINQEALSENPIDAPKDESLSDASEPVADASEPC